MLSSQYLIDEALDLLCRLIATPSFSKEEADTAAVLEDFFYKKNIPTHRKGHNVWATNKYWRDELPVLLLNSHHDTVKPVSGWTINPFQPVWDNDKLFGLGANDAGGALVALIATFIHYYEQPGLPFNLLLAATAEEEISGSGGISTLLSELPPIWCGIVGEPTSLKMAIAERGLMVIDAITTGISGHAARNEGINALYLAIEDIQAIRQTPFERVSPMLGPVSLAVTQINAGAQHNVVPDLCTYVIDVRTNEYYSHQEALRVLENTVRHSALKPRSMRLSSSAIAVEHPLVASGIMLGLETFGSVTLSDQALMPFDTIKLGPGDSARSHTAQEFIRASEIGEGIRTYIFLIEQLAKSI